MNFKIGLNGLLNIGVILLLGLFFILKNGLSGILDFLFFGQIMLTAAGTTSVLTLIFLRRIKNIFWLIFLPFWAIIINILMYFWEPLSLTVALYSGLIFGTVIFAVISIGLFFEKR